jgi:hypothetical protein
MTNQPDTTPAAELAPGRPDTLHVCVDTTPGAHATGSDDIYWWLPIIGPTAAVLAQTLARTTRPGGTSWDTGDLARRIGLAGNRSKLWQSLNRLDRFGVAHFHATDVLTVRVWLPALSDRQLDRLPDDMATAYRNTQRLAG